jgi:hypothetical protein
MSNGWRRSATSNIGAEQEFHREQLVGKKRSVTAVVLFHDFAFDDAIFLASILSQARRFLVVSNTWRSSAA